MSGAGSGGGSFLSRWSRRKRAAVAPVPAAPTPPEAIPLESVPPGAPAPPADRAPAFDPASLPPVESLTAGSDFAAFLREEVPAALRKAALRRAWSLDPAIRDFTGPADYAWDFNAIGSMPGFSLDVPDDVERLLAQAVGLDASPPQETVEEEAPPLAIEAAAPPLPTPAMPEDAPGAPLPVEADALGGEPAPEVLPGPPSEIAESLPPRRRHGGALPT